MVFVIGLTGGIGSGKTTVSNMFGRHGITVIDADIIARQVVELGSIGLAVIVAKFGIQILGDNGELNRNALRKHIFSHPEDRNWLNALLHPQIKKEMILQIQQVSSPYCLLVIPLMIENRLQVLCNRVLVVDVSKETQIARTIHRDNTDETQVKKILARQATRTERLSFANDVIENEYSDQELRTRVETLHNKYLALLEKQRESS
ncbi:dephospho-CoA kinase [Candidatus Enterovibrio escicola]|uniref:Dephospho-CoA kinase n=1 Tax=Candidatus Enterovibrio escicola TaxID=1927127 RepID=A0A2A5T5E3_9GAMM|nr:dephospho-CoA kinase [Candidatus Enterovibrio escacola]PCS23387.1 Dephospho-CoA kinase [Candidatus Enterovibrio escacola]